MKRITKPISKEGAVSALVFGGALFAGLVMIVWRFLIQ